MATIPVAWPEGQGLTFWLDPSSAQAKRLEAVLVLLGGSVTRDLTQASHLLLDVEATHPSLLDILATSGRAQGKSVLSLDWAWRSIQAGQFIGEEDYTIPQRPPPSTPLAAAAVVEQGDAPPVASASASTSSSHSSASAIAVPVRILAPAAPAPEPERHPSGPSRKGKEREVVEVHADAAPIRTTRSSLSHFRTPGSTTSPPYLASSRLSLSSPLVQSRIPLPVSSFGSKTHHRPRPLLLPTPAASAASPPEAFPPPSSVPEPAAFAPKESHSSSPVVPRAAAAAAAPASASSPGVPPAAPSFSRAPPVPAALLPPARSRPAPGALAEPNSLQPATAASFEREQQNQQPSSALPRLFPCPNLPCDKHYAGKTSLNKHLLACPYRTVYGDDQDEDDPFKIQGGGGTAAAGRGKKKPSLGTGRLSGLDREEELELDDGKEEGKNSLHLRNSKALDYTSTVQRPTAHGHFSQRDPHTQDHPSTSVVLRASSSSSQRRPPLSPGSSGKKRRRTVLGPAADVSPTTSNASYRPAAQLALSGTSASLKRRSTGGGGESATAALVPTPLKVSAEGEGSLKKQQMASSMARKTTAKANAPPPPLAPTASTPTRSAAPPDHRNSSSSSRKRGRPSTVGGSGGIGEDLRGGKRLSRVKQESDEEREEEENRSYEAPPEEEEEEEEEEDEEEDELESEESFDEFDAFPGHIP